MNPAVLENPFLAQCFAFSCVLCVGVSLASLAKIFLFRKKPNVSSRRFSVFCFFLSLAVIFYTVLIFMTKNLFFFSAFSREHAGYVFLLLFFFMLGILLGLFWKIVLPLSLIVYLSITIFTNHLLHSLFESQSAVIPISIEENSVTIGTRTVEKTSELHQAVKISSYHLPDTLVLPVKRNWFVLGVFAESPLPFEKILDTSDAVTDREVVIVEFKIENRLALFYLNHFVLSGEPRHLVVPLPSEKIYPSLYSAHISFKNNELSCELLRDL